jgi:Tfp pilus assembly protein PilO
MSEYKKNDLGKPPVLVAIFLFMVSIAIFILIFWPNVQELINIQKEVKTKRLEIQGKENYLRNLSEVKSKLDKHIEEVVVIDYALPDKPYLPSLFDHIQEISSESGLILSEIGISKTSPVEESSYFQETNISVDLTGSYSSLKDFLSSLEKSARLIRIENISFSSEEDDPFFSFSLMMKVYSYSKNNL